MPNHVFKPEHDPPTWFERLLVHPLDTCVALMAVLFSALITLSMVVPPFVPSKALDHMQTWIAFIVAAALGTGGLLAVVGLNWHGRDLSKGWALERFGWLLAGAGFTTYAIAVYAYYPESLFSWAIPLVLGVGSGLRFHSVRRIEQAVRRVAPLVEGGGNE